MTTWEEANVTVVIVPEPTIDLLAAQVAEGYDQDNNQLDPEHAHHGISNQEGTIEFEFTLLSSNTSYSVFVGAKCIVPYPINRNYDSIYTVKIPSPHRSTTNMIITLPD